MSPLQRNLLMFLALLSVVTTASAQQKPMILTDEELNQLIVKDPENFSRTCPELSLIRGKFLVPKFADIIERKNWEPIEGYCPQDQIIKGIDHPLGETFPEPILFSGYYCQAFVPVKVGELACRMAKDYDPTTKALGDKLDVLYKQNEDLRKEVASLKEKIKK